jgi:hypothetical protein
VRQSLELLDRPVPQQRAEPLPPGLAPPAVVFQLLQKGQVQA